MSSISHLLSNPPRFTLYITSSSSLPKTPNFLSLPTPRPISTALTSHRSNTALPEGFNFDHFLSIAELLCLTSSAAVSVGFGLKNAGFMGSGRVLGGGAVALALVVTVGIGVWIRRRQWRRASRETNLFERIEKLEEDLRSSATIVRVLSRQLEKLGIRFRVTRKALKEPIAETAALAQKNSEATRALAAQEDILEKELGETQKLLLAMQEQQQKQLELILAIAKNGKLLDNKQAHNQPESRKCDSSTDNLKQKEPHQI